MQLGFRGLWVRPDASRPPTAVTTEISPAVSVCTLTLLLQCLCRSIFSGTFFFQNKCEL